MFWHQGEKPKISVLSLIEKMAQENNSNSLAVFLSARTLSLTSPNNWKWIPIPGNMKGDLIDAAELINASALQIEGNYDEQKLQEGVTYEVLFVVKLKYNLVIDDPVELSLCFSDGRPQPKPVEVRLNPLPREKWIPLKVAEFTAKNGPGDGAMTFTMKKNSSPLKNGIVIIAAVISVKV